jgi:hypothetical protein
LSGLAPDPHSFLSALREIIAFEFPIFLRYNGVRKFVRDHFAHRRLTTTHTPTSGGVGVDPYGQRGRIGLRSVCYEDRCLKGGDAIIEFAERSISSGTDRCNVTFIRDQPDAVRLFATCSREPNAQGSSTRIGEGGSIPALPSSETIILKKIDDKSVSLQKSKNGDFIDSGKQLSYYGEDAQRMHAQQKAGK